MAFVRGARQALSGEKIWNRLFFLSASCLPWERAGACVDHSMLGREPAVLPDMAGTMATSMPMGRVGIHGTGYTGSRCIEDVAGTAGKTSSLIGNAHGRDERFDLFQSGYQTLIWRQVTMNNPSSHARRPLMLVLGATSGIARATVRLLATQGWDFVLAGRSIEGLQKVADELAALTESEFLEAGSLASGKIRKNFEAGGPVRGLALFDAERPETCTALWDSLPEVPDALLCAVGLLGDQIAARHDPVWAERVLRCNFTGLVPLLALAADAFSARGTGIIVGISSVAGERGRGSNYVYGSAKAGLTAYLSGLRNRLSGSGARVLTVKPGYVATAMMAGRRLPALLTASPEDVARDIVRAMQGRQDVVYSLRRWRWIMAVYRLLPETIASRLPF